MEGGEILLWPPIAGPEGVLLRHAIVTDEGNHHETAPQPPWLVRADGTVTQLVGFELGVSPLLALPGIGGCCPAPTRCGGTTTTSR